MICMPSMIQSTSLSNTPGPHSNRPDVLRRVELFEPPLLLMRHLQGCCVEAVQAALRDRSMNSIDGSAPSQNDGASVSCAGTLDCLREVGILLRIGEASEDLLEGRNFFYARWRV